MTGEPPIPAPYAFSEYFLSEDDLRALMREGQRRRDLDSLVAFGDPIEVSPGDVLVEEGDTERAVYVLAEGEADVLVRDAEDEPKRVARIGAVAVFGEQTFIDGLPRTATVVARTAGRIHRLTAEAFDRLTRDRPDLACLFLTDMVRALSLRCRR